MLRLYVSKGTDKIAAEIRDALRKGVRKVTEILSVTGQELFLVTAAARCREGVGGGGLNKKFLGNEGERADDDGVLRIPGGGNGSHGFDPLSPAEAHEK